MARYIYNVSGEAILSYNSLLGQKEKITFTATASGDSCKNAFCALKKVLENNVKKFLNNIKACCIKVKYYNFNCVKSDITELELYYNIIVENGVIVNQVILDFIPYIPSQSTYSGLTNQKMINKDGTQNNNILNFIGYRTPANKNLNVPALYDEIVSILMEDGSYVSAQKLYIDDGSSFVTTTPYTIYDITTSSGIFKNYKFIKIIFDNTNPQLLKRKVQFIKK
jgi:hypothetical protein